MGWHPLLLITSASHTCPVTVNTSFLFFQIELSDYQILLYYTTHLCGSLFCFETVRTSAVEFAGERSHLSGENNKLSQVVISTAFSFSKIKEQNLGQYSITQLHSYPKNIEEHSKKVCFLCA